MLAPLAPDWDKLDAQRKQKWRGIAQRYPKMAPDEQQRVQQQMRPWAELTPQQRAGRARAVQVAEAAAAGEEAGRPAEVGAVPEPAARENARSSAVKPAAPPPARRARRASPRRRRARRRPLRHPRRPPARPRARPRRRSTGEPPLSGRAAGSGATLGRLATLPRRLRRPGLRSAAARGAGARRRLRPRCRSSRPAAGPASGLRAARRRGPRASRSPAVFGACWLYCVWSWTGGRRTLPMKTWRLRPRHRRRRAGHRSGGAALRYLAAGSGPALALAAYLALHPFGLGAHATWLVAFNFLWAFVDPRPPVPARPDRRHADRGHRPEAGSRSARRDRAGERDAHAISTMPASASASSVSPNSSHAMQRRHRRHEVEQPRDVRRRAVAQQPVQQADRADRQHEHRPAEREDELPVQRTARARTPRPGARTPARRRRTGSPRRAQVDVRADIASGRACRR